MNTETIEERRKKIIKISNYLSEEYSYLICSDPIIESFHQVVDVYKKLPDITRKIFSKAQNHKVIKSITYSSDNRELTIVYENGDNFELKEYKNLKDNIKEVENYLFEMNKEVFSEIQIEEKRIFKSQNIKENVKNYSNLAKEVQYSIDNAVAFFADFEKTESLYSVKGPKIDKIVYTHLRQLRNSAEKSYDLFLDYSVRMYDKMVLEVRKGENMKKELSGDARRRVMKSVSFAFGEASISRSLDQIWDELELKHTNTTKWVNKEIDIAEKNYLTRKPNVPMNSIIKVPTIKEKPENNVTPMAKAVLKEYYDELAEHSTKNKETEEWIFDDLFVKKWISIKKWIPTIMHSLQSSMHYLQEFFDKGYPMKKGTVKDMYPILLNTLKNEIELAKMDLKVCEMPDIQEGSVNRIPRDVMAWANPYAAPLIIGGTGILSLIFTDQAEILSHISAIAHTRIKRRIQNIHYLEDEIKKHTGG